MSDFDVAIVGGGVTGVGIAISCAQSGLKTALIEKNSELGMSTSDNSLRIIHGGFRYLQKLNLLRTVKSLQAQRDLCNLYPELIKPLDCFLVLDRKGLKSPIPAKLGALGYAFLQKLFSSPLQRPRVRKFSELQKILPDLSAKNNDSILWWQDGLLQDPKNLINSEVVQYSNNLSCFLGAAVTSLKKEDQFIVFSNENRILSAKVIVNAAAENAAGIKTEGFEIPKNKPTDWGQAYNLIFRSNHSRAYAQAINGPENRQYFLVPRVLPDGQNALVLGTFTAKLSEEIDSRRIKQDLEYFADGDFPELSFDNLLDLEVGILPAKSPFQSNSDFLEREIIDWIEGYVQIYACKYTTYRQTGVQVARYIQKYLRQDPKYLDL